MIQKLLEEDFCGVTFVMGDFNATVSGEGRLSPARGLHHMSAEPLSREVDACVGSLTELCQDAYTHTHTELFMGIPL